MNIPTGGKIIIKVPGWAVVVAALAMDNMVTNICKLRTIKIIEKHQK